MPPFRAGPVRVRVPATSANLGPGFDCLGLALGLYDDVAVRVVDDGLHVDVAGEGADALPRDETHLVVRALRAALDRLGGQPRGLEVVCANRIPHARGLGSSSAAICAAVLAARELVPGGRERMDDAAALALAAEIEGHPDNVAACLLGGLAVSWGSPARGLRVQPHRDVAALVFVPPTTASTAEVRGLLPGAVPYADAVSNIGRTALLVLAIRDHPELLGDATLDRLHQDYRAPAMPDSAALVAALRAQGHAAAISGAGPSVLVLGSHAAVRNAAGQRPEGWEALELGVDVEGAKVLPLTGPAAAP